MEEIVVLTHGFAKETGKYMLDMVERYHRDMLPYVSFPLQHVFDIIKNIPYRPDPDDVEVLMRPRYTMSSTGYGGDCDDKAIALASYCRLVSIPFRFVAVRAPEKNFLHHVFLYVNLGGRWIAADPTYSFNSLGREQRRYQEYVIIGEG